MRLAALLALAFALLAAPTAARADGPTWSGPPGATPYAAPYASPAPQWVPVKREVSYARQTLLLDGIAVGMMASAFVLNDSESSPMMLGGAVMVYMFGGPTAHFVNSRYAAGFASFGVRMAGPYLGAMLGNLLGPKDHIVCGVGDDCPDSEDSTIGLAIGASVGVLAAMAFDARYLARKQVLEWAPPVAPTFGYARSGFTLGVTGAF